MICFSSLMENEKKKYERIEKLLLLESKEKTKEGDMEFIFLNEIYLNENEILEGT